MIRCCRCKRFTRNNVATRGFESIREAHGDCSRCGPGVEVDWDMWEDWGWTDDDEYVIEARLIAAIEGGAT